MRQRSKQLDIATRGKGLYEFTRAAEAFVEEARIGEGLLTLFCRHTSASLLIQENADPDVKADLAHFFEQVAPEKAGYIHQSEGPDDMPAHIRAALTTIQLSIPVMEGRLVLGTWQGVYLFEHRRAAHRRAVAMHLLGDDPM